MDELGSGPEIEAPRGARLAVVVPVRNGGDDFVACLRGIAASSLRDIELIVVDDSSTDGSAAVAEQFGARVITQSTRTGPGASRNVGAQAARAPIVFFLDADVVVHPDAFGKALARFEADPKLAALFGSYDDQPTAPGIVSAFRNLLHHYTHQQGVFENEARPAHTFWTGCGAIRRHVFLALGGFDPRLYRRPAIEDIELGYRLTRAGHRIALVRDILATHRKRWTIASMIRTDVMHRGVPWMLLLLWSNTKESDLNVSRSQRLSVLATGLLLMSITAGVWQPAFLGGAASALAAIVAMNRQFYRFLARRRGLRFAVASVALHVVYFVCCGVSVAIALSLRMLLTKRADPVTPAHRVDRADAASFPRPRAARGRPTQWTRPGQRP